MTTAAEQAHGRVTVVDDDVVIPVQIGKHTKLITRQSIAERMRDDYEDRHGTGREFDDEDEG